MDADEKVAGAGKRNADNPDAFPRSFRSVTFKKREASSPDRELRTRSRDSALPHRTGTSEETKDQICICTPAPKIPRPRNAFILYRQYHQSQVTSENPRLSNPDISKIIGQKWKDEEEDVKEKWKRMAEEEKQRHQLQYPEYRYQPRRGAKSQATRTGTTLSDDQERCKKCGGRLIAASRSNPSSTHPGTSQADADLDSRETPDADRMEVDRPRGGSAEHPQQSQRFSGAFQSESTRSGDSVTSSPDSKRQRMDRSGGYHSVRLPRIEPPLHESRMTGEHWRTRSDETMPTGNSPFDEAATLAELRYMPRTTEAHMPPPPRPVLSGPSSVGFYAERPGPVESNVRLPPLQTALSTPTRPTTHDQGSLPTPSTGNFRTPHYRDPGATSSLEAQIMSLSFKRKISVLSRVAKPMFTSSRHLPYGPMTRGAFVAVEGPDSLLLRDVSKVVEASLKSLDRAEIRTWTGEGTNRHASGRRSLPPFKSEHDQGLPRHEFDSPVLHEYFRTVLDWQERSREIADFVTHRTRTPHSTTSDEQKGGLSGSSSPSTVPVALIKDGFSLTLSDRYACTIPIEDAYSPMDHWQWMASLWRGVVSPDLLIYVKPAGDDEIRDMGFVEFVKHMGLMVVRSRWGQGLDESAERRISFEVAEWMREGYYLDGHASHYRQEM